MQARGHPRRANTTRGGAQKLMAPRERGAIRPRDLRVTKREFTSRSGTSPPRSVHQWTARAWVPVYLAEPSDSRPSTCPVYSHPAAKNSLDFDTDLGLNAAIVAADQRLR